MIDLRSAEMPSTIEVDGVFYAINTDFRIWIDWLDKIEGEGIALYSIFADEVPRGSDWVAAALEFAESPTLTPKAKADDNAPRLVDFVLDGDYLTGSFQAAYGIDLTTCSMHWHRFLALVRCLPESSKMAEIMAYRGWDAVKAKKKPDQAYKELKRAWALPMRKTPENEAVVKWAEKAFENIEYPD